MWSLVSTTCIRDELSISMHIQDNLQRLLVICGRQFPLRVSDKHHAPTRQPAGLLVICGRQFLLRVSQTKCQAPCTYKTTCCGSQLYVVVSFHYVYQRLNINLHAPIRQPAALLVICGRQFPLRVSENKCQAPCTCKITCSSSQLYVVVSFHYVYQTLNVNLHASTR